MLTGYVIILFRWNSISTRMTMDMFVDCCEVFEILSYIYCINIESILRHAYKRSHIGCIGFYFYLHIVCQKKEHISCGIGIVGRK